MWTKRSLDPSIPSQRPISQLPSEVELSKKLPMVVLSNLFAPICWSSHFNPASILALLGSHQDRSGVLVAKSTGPSSALSLLQLWTMFHNGQHSLLPGLLSSTGSRRLSRLAFLLPPGRSCSVHCNILPSVQLLVRDPLQAQAVGYVVLGTQYCTVQADPQPAQIPGRETVLPLSRRSREFPPTRLDIRSPPSLLLSLTYCI